MNSGLVDSAAVSGKQDMCAGAVTTAALADFSNAPPARQTSMDLFSTTGKQPQSMAANSDHNVGYVPPYF